jgi:hypothetical protein
VDTPWPFFAAEYVELADEVLRLRAENAALHEALAIERRRSAALCDYGNRGWARVGTLSTRANRLLRIAKWWRAPGRKPMDEHLKALMAVRYLMLGGIEHGKGELAKRAVAKEFKCSLSTVERVVRKYKT